VWKSYTFNQAVPSKHFITIGPLLQEYILSANFTLNYNGNKTINGSLSLNTYLLQDGFDSKDMTDQMPPEIRTDLETCYHGTPVNFPAEVCDTIFFPEGFKPATPANSTVSLAQEVSFEPSQESSSSQGMMISGAIMALVGLTGFAIYKKKNTKAASPLSYKLI